MNRAARQTVFSFSVPSIGVSLIEPPGPVPDEYETLSLMSRSGLPAARPAFDTWPYRVRDAAAAARGEGVCHRWRFLAWLASNGEDDPDKHAKPEHGAATRETAIGTEKTVKHQKDRRETAEAGGKQHGPA